MTAVVTTTKTTRRKALALLGAGAATSALPGCRTHAPNRGARELTLAPEIDAVIGRALTLDLTPALSVAVYSRDGRYARASGLADVETGERASSDTAFYVASSTKSMTALALAGLHARGELNLDATLSEFSPEAAFPSATRPAEVRLRDLLAHIGGIVNEPLEYRFAWTGQHDPETLWRLLAVSEPNAEAPLGRFEYTNVGYNITTLLTDRRLGVRWQDLLQREIFEPARMTRSSARMSRAGSSGWSVARPHRFGTSGVRKRSYLEKTDQTMHSAGGVVMSAEDATRWLELMIENGRVGGRQCVAPEVVQRTRAPLANVGVDFDGYRRETYGLGWYIGPHRGERMLHQFGGYNGFRAHVSYLPDQAIGVAAFANDSTVGLRLINVIANYVYDRAGGYSDAEERFETELAAITSRYAEAARRVVAERAKHASLQWALTRPNSAYAGIYENPEWGRIEIDEERDTLRVTWGVLRTLAEVSGEPETIRVELVPGDGAALQFEGGGTKPDSLTLGGRLFRRAS